MPHIDNCRSGMLSLDTSSSGMTRGDILRYRIAFALMPTRKIVTELKGGNSSNGLIEFEWDEISTKFADGRRGTL